MVVKLDFRDDDSVEVEEVEEVSELVVVVLSDVETDFEFGDEERERARRKRGAISGG